MAINGTTNPVLSSNRFKEWCPSTCFNKHSRTQLWFSHSSVNYYKDREWNFLFLADPTIADSHKEVTTTKLDEDHANGIFFRRAAHLGSRPHIRNSSPSHAGDIILRRGVKSDSPSADFLLPTFGNLIPGVFFLVDGIPTEESIFLWFVSNKVGDLFSLAG